MSEKKSEKKKSPWGKIVDAILVLFILLLIGLEVDIMITTKRDKIPSLFGTSFMRVLTDSMDGGSSTSLHCTKNTSTTRVTGVYHTEEEAKEKLKDGEEYYVIKKNGPAELHVGTGITINKISFDSVSVGDVITFNPSSDGDAYLTHRVVEKLPDYQGSGVTCFKTKGDANDSEDTFLIDEERVVGVVTFKIPLMGYVVRFVQMRWYFIVPIIALIFVFFKLMGIYLGPSKKEAAEETSSENGEASGDSPPVPEATSESEMVTDKEAAPPTETVSKTEAVPAQTDAAEAADSKAEDKADDSSKKK